MLDTTPEPRGRMPRPEPRPVALRARGIVKRIGMAATSIEILKGIDLDLCAGELTLLMGPSGSGKTTLLSILGCLLSATEGTVEVAGLSTAGMGPEGLAEIRRQHVGFVFQSYNLFPTLTAAENIMTALDLRGILASDIPEHTASALAAVGLSHRANAYPSKMSGGEKQRVAIARALGGSPAVVLADEPTAALDSENGKAVMELLADVAKDDTRVVLAVTHDHRTLTYADRIIRIEDGRIVGDERPKQKATAPAPPPPPRPPTKRKPRAPAGPATKPNKRSTLASNPGAERHV